jgi:hypothetical protein
MALSLSLSTIQQSNDNTILRIVDNTGSYSSTNITGWGTPNTALSTINGSTNELTITVTITNSSNESVTYDPIDVYDYLGHAPSDTDDLVIYITPDLLLSSGTALGAEDDELPDGWYDIEYSLDVIATSANISSYEVQILVDGIVRNKIYDMLLTIPRTSYESTPYRIYTHNWNDLTYPLYVRSLFDAMVAYVTPARKNEILEMLNLVERLTL